MFLFTIGFIIGSIVGIFLMAIVASGNRGDM